MAWHFLKLRPVHVILRRGAAGTAALALCALVCLTSFAVVAWETSGQVSPPTSQRFDPLTLTVRAAGGPKHEHVTHEWVIPVGRSSISVPILMYHYIRTPPSVVTDRLGFNLSVAPSDFSAQMDWLGGHDYHPVTLVDLRAYFAGRQPLPSKPVVITLDDGYSDLYTTAFPILQAHNFKAVAYIVSGFVGRSRYVTAAQVVELSNYGIEIASHTVSHPDLARTSLPLVFYELAASKESLQKLVGHPVVDFAYPSGRFSPPVIAALFVTGYQSATTTMPGTYHSEADRYMWTRVRVRGGESLIDFTQSLGPVEKTVEITDVDVAGLVS